LNLFDVVKFHPLKLIVRTMWIICPLDVLQNCRLMLFVVLSWKHNAFSTWCFQVDASYGGSKAPRDLVPKIHVNGKINIIMQKMLKPMLRGPYVVINQLIKSIWKAAHLQNTLLYMLGEKKYQFNKIWSRLGLLKMAHIWSFKSS